jgi:Trk K+ transport system NAD-binding subunit
VIGVLKADSPCVNKLIKECFPIREREDLDLVAIFRDGHTVLPHPEQMLRSGDRILVIASFEGWELNKQHFSELT